MSDQNISNKQQKDISEIDLFTQGHNKALNYIAGIFIFVFILFWFWNTDSFSKIPKGPDLGDTFNIFNALMAAITIIFVYGAYRLQLEAYQLQKKELEETRKVFKEQEEEMREQKEIMKEEKFYNQLHFLLQQREKFLEQIEYKYMKYSSSRIAKGKEILDFWTKDIEMLSDFNQGFNSIDFIENYIFRDQILSNNSDKHLLIEFKHFYQFYTQSISGQYLKKYKEITRYIQDFIKKSKEENLALRKMNFLENTIYEDYLFQVLDLFEEYYKKHKKEKPEN